MKDIITSPVAADPRLCAALFEAVRWHETRDLPSAIDKISFAEDGQSGGSFGAMQNDCYASDRARAVFADVMRANNMPPEQLGRVLGQVSLHQVRDPLSSVDRAAVDAALGSAQGQAAIEALDREVFAVTLPDLDHCIAAAKENGGATITVAAAMGMLIWFNAAGPPSIMLLWLEGKQVIEHAGIPRRLSIGQVISEDDLVDYLAKTLEMARRPSLIKDLADAITVGLGKLNGSAPALAPLPPAPTADQLNRQELDRLDATGTSAF